ncbi:MAG: hypothetical protein ACKOA1_12410 [Bacteroidota bacterium]
MKSFRSVFYFLFFSLSMLKATESIAQARVTTVGLCYKPIFPVDFLRTGPVSIKKENVQLTTGLNKGFSGGMVIRRGFSDLLAGEAGIQYIRRDYDFSIIDSNVRIDRSFRTIGYEIPVSAMVFVQLAEKLFMNASLGTGIDAFASSVRTSESTFEQIAKKRYVVQPIISANLGWEYRTTGSGTIYLGATFHRPINSIYNNGVNYRNNGKDVVLVQELSGSYITADLRYYFHEDPDVKRKKKKASK